MTHSLTFSKLNPFLFGFLVALAIFMAGPDCAGGDSPAFAAETPKVPVERIVDQHDRGDFLPNLPTWLMLQIRDRGYGTYAMDSRTANYPGGSNSPAETIKRCFRAEQAITTIPWYPVAAGERADLTFYMPDGMEMGYAGSAYYTSIPAFINVNFRVGYTVWDSTYCHEIGHVMGQEDLYKHPLTCDTFAKYTMMSCGTFIGAPTPYDRDIQRNVFMPDLPAVTWVHNDSRYVWLNWNGIRKSSVGCQAFAGAAINNPSTQKDNICGHYTAANDMATHVAIFYNDGTGWVFSGYYGDAPVGASTAHRGFERSWWCPSWSPGRQFGVRPESAIPGTWYGWDFSLAYVSGDISPVGGCV